MLKLVDDAKTVLLFSSGENNILQVMVKVVKGVRPDLAAIPRNRPPACSGFLSLMQRCWTTNPQARPSFQSTYCWFDTLKNHPSPFTPIDHPGSCFSERSVSPSCSCYFGFIWSCFFLQISQLKLRSSAQSRKRRLRCQPHPRWNWSVCPLMVLPMNRCVIKSLSRRMEIKQVLHCDILEIIDVCNGRLL